MNWMENLQSAIAYIEENLTEEIKVRDVAEKWSGDGEGGENNARGERNFKRDIITGELEQKGYYVKMAVAWMLSMCFVKYYEETKSFMRVADLDDFTYNKAIQKARESLRLSAEQKAELAAMKR